MFALAIEVDLFIDIYPTLIVIRWVPQILEWDRNLAFVLLIIGFFFFKQKTAYEMRISDWSSDVCSSDLSIEVAADLGDIDRKAGDRLASVEEQHRALRMRDLRRPLRVEDGAEHVRDVREGDDAMLVRQHPFGRIERSEERRVGKERVRTCTSRWSPYP